MPKQKQGSAQERARELLLSWLTPEQEKTFKEQRYFEVVGNHTGDVYRISTHTTTHNVSVEKLGRRVNYCAYPRNAHELPMEDIWLAQALSITSNEMAWLGVAIKSDPFPLLDSVYGFGGAYGWSYPPGATVTYDVDQLISRVYIDWTE